jgi:histone-lysine N-methyltransferase SETMAR
MDPGVRRVSHLKKAERSWKHAKTTTSAGKVMASASWNSQDVLFIDFLIEQRSANAAYYSKLLQDGAESVFRSKRRGRSVKSICLLHDKTSTHTAAVTTETLDEMHWEVLLHPAYGPDLSPCDFYPFGWPKEDQGGKRFRADDEVILLVQQWLDEQSHTLFQWVIMKLPGRW